jgi:hypothetical protein
LVTGRFVIVTGPSVATASEVVLAKTASLPATTELVSVDV